MALDVVSETVIDRPREVVAAYVADPTNAPFWYANIKSMRWESQPPVGLGSRMAFEARFLGRSLSYTYEVTDFIPGERLVMRTSEGPLPDGDDVPLGTRVGRPNADDAAKPRRTALASPDCSRRSCQQR